MKKFDSLPRKFTDLQLYELLKKGDPNAIKHIEARYKRLLFWIGRQVLNDDFAVETLMQDVYLKLWIKRDSIETPIHMRCFLRFVLKRDCLAYRSAPKNKFNRLLNSLESFDNYQDYLAGYDPVHDKENLLSQETDQNNFDEVKKVLTLLKPKRKRLIELCLEYGFQYKAIAIAMGSGIKEISNEVNKAIGDLREIINGTPHWQPQEKRAETRKQPQKLSDRQQEIMKRRMEQKTSFAIIARELKMAEKEVHREFLQAYQFIQQQNHHQILS